MPTLLPGVEADSLRLAALALAEDGPADLTSQVTVPESQQGDGRIEFRSAGVLAGVAYADAVARATSCSVQWSAAEGVLLPSGAVAGHLSGNLRAVLRAERPLLNLLQRAVGIATLTRQYVEAVGGTGCRVLHTRKTAPGLRLFDLAAVLAGGGSLHRTDLASVVMVKDNHWRALAGSARPLPDAMAEARAAGAARIFIEVESREQVEAACAAGADRLLVDNQEPGTLTQWARLARSSRPGIEIEATGGINLDNARDYALAGADFISIGALTHSVTAADIALEL